MFPLLYRNTSYRTNISQPSTATNTALSRAFVSIHGLISYRHLYTATTMEGSFESYVPHLALTIVGGYITLGGEEYGIDIMQAIDPSLLMDRAEHQIALARAGLQAAAPQVGYQNTGQQNVVQYASQQVVLQQSFHQHLILQQSGDQPTAQQQLIQVAPQQPFPQPPPQGLRGQMSSLQIIIRHIEAKSRLIFAAFQRATTPEGQLALYIEADMLFLFGRMYGLDLPPILDGLGFHLPQDAQMAAMGAAQLDGGTRGMVAHGGVPAVHGGAAVGLGGVAVGGMPNSDPAGMIERVSAGNVSSKSAFQVTTLSEQALTDAQDRNINYRQPAVQIQQPFQNQQITQQTLIAPARQMADENAPKMPEAHQHQKENQKSQIQLKAMDPPVNQQPAKRKAPEAVDPNVPEPTQKKARQNVVPKGQAAAPKDQVDIPQLSDKVEQLAASYKFASHLDAQSQDIATSQSAAPVKQLASAASQVANPVTANTGITGTVPCNSAHLVINHEKPSTISSLASGTIQNSTIRSMLRFNLIFDNQLTESLTLMFITTPSLLGLDLAKVTGKATLVNATNTWLAAGKLGNVDVAKAGKWVQEPTNQNWQWYMYHFVRNVRIKINKMNGLDMVAGKMGYAVGGKPMNEQQKAVSLRGGVQDGDRTNGGAGVRKKGQGGQGQGGGGC